MRKKTLFAVIVFVAVICLIPTIRADAANKNIKMKYLGKVGDEWVYTVKNVSKKNLSVSINALAKNKKGKSVSATDDYIPILVKGKSTVAVFRFDAGSSKIKSCKFNIKTEKAPKDYTKYLSVKRNKSGRSVIAELKNKSKKDVTYNIVLLTYRGKKLVGIDDEFHDISLDAGEMQALQLYSYGNKGITSFKSYKIYYCAWEW